MKLNLPSLPLPGGSGYRAAWPSLTASMLAKLDGTTLVHSHSFFLAGFAALATARKKGVPLVLTFHTMLEAYSHYAGAMSAIVKKCMRSFIRRVANCADVVTVPTHGTAAYLKSIGVLTRIIVIPSGIDTDAIDLAVPDASITRRLAVPTGHVVILCVARLGKEKNLELLLHAFAGIEIAATLLIAGDGPQRKALEQLTRQLGIASRVRFLGVVDRTSLAAIYRISNLFAFPSATETQGLVLAEALYAELPIVAIDTAPGREVTAGSDAVLVVPTVEAFRAALATMLAAESQDELRAKRKTCGARYDRRVTTKQMVSLYNELIAR